MISAGSWSGTRRIEILANALLGSTVLAPGWMYPPQMPLTSNVGRAAVRSEMVYAGSPQSVGTPASWSHVSRSKGALASAVRSSGGSSRTLS